MKLSGYLFVLSVGLFAGCAGHKATDQKPAPTAKNHNPYNKPLTSIGAKFGGLPPAVQNTVSAEAGSEEIADVTKNTLSGQVVYVIYFRNPALFPPLYVAPDGSVLNPDLTVAVGAPHESIGVSHLAAIKPSDLPPNVMRTVQERAPNTEIAHISTEIRGDRLVYIVSFKDAAHYPALSLAEDGTVLNDSPR